MIYLDLAPSCKNAVGMIYRYYTFICSLPFEYQQKKYGSAAFYLECLVFT